MNFAHEKRKSEQARINCIGGLGYGLSLKRDNFTLFGAHETLLKIANISKSKYRIL